MVSAQARDIQKTLDILEKAEWEGIVESLYNAQTIYAYGTGFSQRKALDEFSKSLLPHGEKVIVIPNKTELDMTMPIITSSDLVIIASLSGETLNIKDNILTLELRQIPLLSVTRLGENFMSKHSDYSLHYQSSKIALASHYQFESLLCLSVVMDYVYRKFVEYRFK